MKKKRTQKALSLSNASRTRISGTNQPDNEEVSGYEERLIHLFHVGQRLCGQAQEVGETLAQEVTQITQGQAKLSLHCQERAGQPPPGGSISFPVQFSDLTYGTLYVQNDPVHPTQPIIPPARAYLLAQICASILYALEASAFLQSQYQHLEVQAYEPLTRRQRQVLNLLCLGYDLEAIAEELGITVATVDSHRQHIYERLQVHNEHDLLLMAFRAGLFSPLEGVSGIRPHVQT